MLCKNENETFEHFMLICTELDLVRQPILDDIAQVSQRLGIAIDRENSEEFLQLLLDSTAILPDRYADANASEYNQLERNPEIVPCLAHRKI